MGYDPLRDYLKNPREFDTWLKTSAIVGSIFSIGILLMVLVGAVHKPNLTTELSSVSKMAPQPKLP